MKNLTTRKFVFGMLMACVLAFGVQGVVEAQTTTVSGDTAVTSSTTGVMIIPVATISTGDPLERSFTLRVTAEDGQTVTIPTPTNAAVTEIKTTTAPSDPASDPDDAADPDPSPAKDEIVSGTTITFGGLGTKNDGNAGTTNGDPNTATWTFKVTYTVSALGNYEIEVPGNDPSPDIQAYVVQSKGRAASYEIDKETAGDITQTPQTSSGNIEVQVTDGTNDQAWVQVDLTITGGKLYPTGQFLSGSRIHPLNAANDNGYTSLSVFTNDTGSISVRVNPDRDRTATVTAKISGVSGDHASHTVTYFYNAVTIERVSGNYQHAKEGDRLTQPLVVRVLDGTRNVANQRVRFTASGGMLRSVTSSDFIRETGSAEGTTTISVKTNSSGQAKVYLTVPTTAAVVTVDAAVAGTPPAPGTNLAALGTTNQFTVFAVERDSTVLGPLTIDGAPNTPVENADPDRNGLWVGTTATAPTEVRFTVTGGQLYLNPALLDLDANSLRQSTDRPQYVTELRVSTDASGDIGSSGSPIVFVKVNSGVAEVRVEILRSSSDAAVRTIQYITGSVELDAVSGGSPRVGGVPGGLRENPFVVRATIGGSPASGQTVKFTTSVSTGTAGILVPVPGTEVFVTSPRGFMLAPAAASPDTLIPAPGSHVTTVLREEEYTSATDAAIFVRKKTDAQGEAKVYLQMGNDNAGELHTVTAQLPVGSESVEFEVRSRDSDIAARLTKIEVPDIHANDAERETLAVRVENLDSDPLPGVNIRWTTTDDGVISLQTGRGTLTDKSAAETPPAGTPTSGEEIFVLTNRAGEAWVTYLKDEDKANQSVRAEIASETGCSRLRFRD